MYENLEWLIRNDPGWSADIGPQVISESHIAVTLYYDTGCVASIGAETLAQALAEAERVASEIRADLSPDEIDPMLPDYETLAAREPTSQVEDSRDAAGLGLGERFNLDYATYV